MAEPRVRFDEDGQQSAADRSARSGRVVHMTVSLEWAQALHRLQQLHNLGYTQIRLQQVDDHIRIEPND